MREQKDLGLLILRGAGLLLVATFGVQKIGWYWSAFHAGKSLSSAGLAPLIARMGFPIPVGLALWIAFNESIGAFLIACGLLTRLVAASAALGMAGALYTSVRLGEDWLRAALYLIVFIALIFTGAGKFSVDHLLKRKKSPTATARTDSRDGF
jgi:putative oxidoreductase